MMHFFKGQVKIVNIYMVKFNVSILNSLTIMLFFVNTKYIHKHNVLFTKTVTKLVTILTILACFVFSISEPSIQRIGLTIFFLVYPSRVNNYYLQNKLQGSRQLSITSRFYDNCPRGKLSPNPKTNPNPNPNPNQGAIFLRGQLFGYQTTVLA